MAGRCPLNVLDGGKSRYSFPESSRYFLFRVYKVEKTFSAPTKASCKSFLLSETAPLLIPSQKRVRRLNKLVYMYLKISYVRNVRRTRATVYDLRVIYKKEKSTKNSRTYKLIFQYLYALFTFVHFTILLASLKRLFEKFELPTVLRAMFMLLGMTVYTYTAITFVSLFTM